MVAIGAGAAEEGPASGRDILRGEPLQHALHFDLPGMTGQLEARGARRLRHVAEELIDRGDADFRQHHAAIVLGQRQITHGFVTIL